MRHNLPESGGRRWGGGEWRGGEGEEVRGDNPAIINVFSRLTTYSVERR